MEPADDAANSSPGPSSDGSYRRRQSSKSPSPDDRRPSKWGSLLGRKESTIQGSNNRRTSASRTSPNRDDEQDLSAGTYQDARAAAVRLKDCLAETDETVGQTLEALAGQSEAALEQTDLVEQEREEVMNALEKLHYAAFDSLGRSVQAKIRAFAEIELESTRQALKAQSVWFDMKLSNSRTAGELKLRNQAAELEATHARQLENRMAQLTEGGDEALRELHEKLQEANNKLAKVQPKLASAADELKTAKKLLSTSEAQREKAVEEKEKLGVEATEAKRLLAEALASLDVKIDENTSLSQQVADLVNRVAEVREKEESENVELKQQQAELQKEQSLLLSSLAEAAAEAERASVMAAEECKSQVSEMAKRMREENEQAQRGMREMAGAQLARLLAELHSMSLTMTSMEGDYDGLNKQHVIVVQERDELKVQLAEVMAAAAAAGKGGGKELADAKARIEELEKEIDSGKNRLTDALKELGITVDSNRSLKETIQDLMQGTETARKEVEEARGELERALKELGMTGKENQTLKERVKELKDTILRRQAEVEESKASINKLLEELQVEREGNKSLIESVRELGAAAKSSKNEVDDIKNDLVRALAELDVKIREGSTLGEHLRELQMAHRLEIQSHERTVDALHQALNEARQALRDSQMSMAAEMANETAKWKEEVTRLKLEIARLREAAGRQQSDLEREVDELKAQITESANTLDEALRSVGSLTHDKQDLADQVRQLVMRYQRTRDTLAYLIGELKSQVAQVEDAVKAKEVAVGEVERVKEHASRTIVAVEAESRHERELLVKAALRSLQQLRNHIFTAMAGDPLSIEPTNAPSTAPAEKPPTTRPPRPARPATASSNPNRAVNTGNHYTPFSEFVTEKANSNRPGTANSMEGQTWADFRDWGKWKHRWGIVGSSGDTTVISFEKVAPSRNASAERLAAAERAFFDASTPPPALQLPKHRPPSNAANSISPRVLRQQHQPQLGGLTPGSRPPQRRIQSARAKRSTSPPQTTTTMLEMAMSARKTSPPRSPSPPRVTVTNSGGGGSRTPFSDAVADAERRRTEKERMLNREEHPPTAAEIIRGEA